MDMLITLIGNAAVDPVFRAKFLADPLKVAETYGFRMTKGEVEIMLAVFDKKNAKRLADAFQVLQDALYVNPICPRPPCLWSLYPPPEYIKDYKK